MNNIFNFMKSMLNQRNPYEVMKNIANSNPAMNRAMQMTNGKSGKDIEQICKNLCNERGIDFEKAFNEFQSRLK